MYNVVFRTIGDDNYKGVVTWSTFENEEKFLNWYDEKIKGRYEIVDQGVSCERAIELCTTPEANSALLTTYVRIVKNTLEKIESAINEIDIWNE